MFFKVICGEDQGKMFMADDVNLETGIVTTGNRQYFIEHLEELSEAERNKHFKIEEVDLS